MTHDETGPTQQLPPPTPASARWRWSTWIRRGVLAGFLLLLVVVQWPMLKGLVYGISPPAPVSPDQLPQWRAGYEAALAESKETGKPVLIDFTASWCPPCRVMEADVWPDEEVRAAIAEHVVPLQLDVDEPTSAAAAQRYGIMYIPTIVLVNSEGNELARGAFMTAGDMVDFIERNASPQRLAPVTAAD